MRALIEGGMVEASRFRDSAENTIEAFLTTIRHTWFGNAAAAGMEGYRDGRGISWLEKQLDDRFMAYVRRGRYVAMGLEALVGHLVARETEIRNVRIILTGKVNRIPHEDILERLRVGYA
jgi:V/A-type H+/Na+-transporting ATPase subunit C